MRLRLPPYVQAFTDRHGKSRYYLRKPGIRRVALPGLPWSPEFMHALSLASAGSQPSRENLGSQKTMPGTINALTVAYFNSGDFKSLSENTRTTYRGIIDNFRVKHGDKRVTSLQRQNVLQMMSKKAETPAAAHNLLRIIRLLMKFAVIHGWRPDDPTTGLKAPKMRSDGFYTWSEDDIPAFEVRHPIGSRARLANEVRCYSWMASR
jgi:hypothetical protein